LAVNVVLLSSLAGLSMAYIEQDITVKTDPKLMWDAINESD